MYTLGDHSRRMDAASCLHEAGEAGTASAAAPASNSEINSNALSTGKSASQNALQRLLVHVDSTFCVIKT